MARLHHGAGNKEPWEAWLGIVFPSTSWTRAHALTSVNVQEFNSYRVGTFRDCKDVISFGPRCLAGIAHTIVSYVSSTGVKQHEDGKDMSLGQTLRRVIDRHAGASLQHWRL